MASNRHEVFVNNQSKGFLEVEYGRWVWYKPDGTIMIFSPTAYKVAVLNFITAYYSTKESVKSTSTS